MFTSHTHGNYHPVHVLYDIIIKSMHICIHIRIYAYVYVFVRNIFNRIWSFEYELAQVCYTYVYYEHCITYTLPLA
jgi:hypothetical protein